MAQKLTQGKRQAEQDQERLRAAVDQVAQSDSLRYLFRDIFSSAGVLSPLPEGNALETARAAGRQDLALGVIAIFESHKPALWPSLLLEDLNEQLNRNKAAVVERRSGGGADDTDLPATSDTDDQY